MIQTILIVLVAVVVLIVIIAVLALRYLRADDSDTFDDIPDEPRPARRRVEQVRERMPAPPTRRPRHPEPATEVWAADRPARMPDSRAPAGFRDRDARPSGPQRAISQPPGRREPAGPRPVRAGARPEGPGSATSSWDSLSDVDYWAELAADNKAEITAAAAGPAAAGRYGTEPPSDIRPAPGRPGPADSGQFPVRGRRQPSRPSQPSRPVGAPAGRNTDAGHTEQIDARGPQPVTARYNGDLAASSPDVLGRHSQPRPAPGQRPDPAAAPQRQRQRPAGNQRPAGQRPSQPAPAAQPAYESRPPAAAAAPYSNGHGRGRADDDPLTSPSFPAVGTSDSRSYRTRRSSQNSQPGTSGQHPIPAAGQGTSHQFIEYSSAPRRSASQPNGYSAPPTAPPAETTAQPAPRGKRHKPPAAQPPAPQPPAAPATAAPAAAAANPYGSFVSDQPQPAHSLPPSPQSGYPSAGYPETPAPSLAAAAYNGYAAGQHNGTGDRYAAPAIANGRSQSNGQPADGYLPAAGLGGNGIGGGSHARNGSQTRGYAGIDYSNLSYDDPAYSDPAGALPGYGSAGQPVPQYDQQGYGAPDPGPDGYRAYRGNGNGNGRLSRPRNRRS